MQEIKIQCEIQILQKKYQEISTGPRILHENLNHCLNASIAKINFKSAIIANGMVIDASYSSRSLDIPSKTQLFQSTDVEVPNIKFPRFPAESGRSRCCMVVGMQLLAADHYALRKDIS